MRQSSNYSSKQATLHSVVVYFLYVNFTQSSHGTMQGSGETAEGIPGPPPSAYLWWWFLWPEGCWCVCTWLWPHHCELVTVWALRATLTFCKWKEACVSWVSKLWGLLCAGAAAQLSHLSVKWKRLLQQSDSHLFSKCSWVIWWADPRSWQYTLKGYWYHQSARVWLLLCCGFSCPISSWRAVWL